MDTFHFKGFSIPGDILLFLGLPNDFDQTHMSAAATEAASERAHAFTQLNLGL
jgi:hypothetical protein